MISPRRYGELLDNLVGMGTNLLASRLRDMEQAGLVENDNRIYRLTDRGRLLEPVVHELVRFGLALEITDGVERLSRPEWDAVALRALYQPEMDTGLSGQYVLEIDAHPFSVEKVGSEVRVRAGDVVHPRLRLALSKEVAVQLVRGDMRLDDALVMGEATLDGSKREAARLLRAFSLVDTK